MCVCCTPISCGCVCILQVVSTDQVVSSSSRASPLCIKASRFLLFQLTHHHRPLAIRSMSSVEHQLAMAAEWNLSVLNGVSQHPVTASSPAISPSSSTFSCSSSDAEDQRPPYSYIALILKAIEATSDKRQTLSGIYQYIAANFPYYRNHKNVSGWQNSIRHNLSLNGFFQRVGRDKGTGKGGYWTTTAEAQELFEGGNFKRRRRQPKPSPARPRRSFLIDDIIGESPNRKRRKVMNLAIKQMEPIPYTIPWSFPSFVNSFHPPTLSTYGAYL